MSTMNHANPQSSEGLKLHYDFSNPALNEPAAINVNAGGGETITDVTSAEASLELIQLVVVS